MASANRLQFDWRTAALQESLAPNCPGLRVRFLDEVDSTSTHLLEACRTDPAAPLEPMLLVAEHQSGGRGRQGRAWSSERGTSLTFSLAWPLQRADLSGLSLAVGVALADALDGGPAATPRIGLKWPNDLWLIGAAQSPGEPGRKLGGILIETSNHGAARTAVIGIGLNVLPIVVDDARSGVACLRELDPDAQAPAVLHRVALPLVKALRRFDVAGFGAFASRYRARDLLFGRQIQAGALAGTAEGVASSGALRLRDAAGLHEIFAGEVSVTVQVDSLVAAAPRAAC